MVPFLFLHLPGYSSRSAAPASFCGYQGLAEGFDGKVLAGAVCVALERRCLEH